MSNYKNKTKIKLFATIVAIFMLFVNGGLVLINSAKSAIDNIVHAASTYTATEITLSNKNFTSPTSGTYPLTPSNWTNLNKTSDITSGIVDLGTSFEDNKEKYNLDFKPSNYQSMTDNQVLMINAKDSNASSGYKSSSFTLTNSGYYVLSFWAYTENTASRTAVASAKITGNEKIESNTSNILTINTSNGNHSNWQEYKMFIETDAYNSLTLNLELWLGSNGQNSNGSVFFDNVNIYSYDHQTYNEMKAFATEGKYVVIDNNEGNVANFITNSNFENGLNGWELIDESSSTATNNCITDVVYIDDNYNSDITKVSKAPNNANLYNNQKALLINNLVSGNVGYKSETFTVEQNKLYKLSFLAKTGSLDGSAQVNLVERNPYTNAFLSDGSSNPNYNPNSQYEAQTYTIKDIKTNDYQNSKTGDWKEYSFYIKGSAYLNSEVTIEIWLGTEDAKATGYAFFDNFTLSKTNYDNYKSGSANGTVANLSKATTETDFANGTFNNIVIKEIDEQISEPENWTNSKTNNSANTQNGIVNTSKNYSSLSIPQITPINASYNNNNVLMIGNVFDNNQKYTSNSVNLNADSYYKLSVMVLTADLNKATAGIKLIYNDSVVAQKLNIVSNNSWTTYNFLIKTGFESKSIKLELSLGETAEGTGYAFFDNVLLTSNLTEDDYNQSLANSSKVNLKDFDFTNIPETSTDGIYTPNDFDAKKQAGNNGAAITSGVIDTSKYNVAGGFQSSLPNPEKPENSDSYVLMIRSIDDVYYTYTSKNTAKLTAGNYYKIDVTLKTYNLSQEESNKQLKEGSTTDYIPFGASIVIDGIDAKFIGIDTENEYKTYTIYINCTDDADIKLILGLGSDKALTSGCVYFADSSITKIDEAVYTEGVSVLEDNAEENDNILAVGSTEKITDRENTPTGSDINFDWLIVPSLITALTIIVAVVGVLMRSVKKHSPKKVKVQKVYSRENVKRISDINKKEISKLNNEVKLLNKSQNEIAGKINNLKLDNSEQSKKEISNLEASYKENQQKIAKLNLQKQELQTEYKNKIRDLKAEKLADKNLKKHK